jgi:alcohol dehydrogenase class IV
VLERRREDQKVRTISFLQPKRLDVGSGSINQCIRYLEQFAGRSVHIIGIPSQLSIAETIAAQLRQVGCSVSLDCSIDSEPTIAIFHAALDKARSTGAACVLGIGGGSALDLAKLVAAFLDSTQPVEETFGIGLLRSRSCHLVCVPTTSGTGSEVSPNAILLEESTQLKKGVVSPFLVPDATFIDPALTLSVPPTVTAATGLDALTHCIEAYTNKFAHPLVDVYALEGIARCGQSLLQAVKEPSNLEARESMSIVSLYGGLCLGPVNTAAVHALAYPLGGEFHIAHGLSNAILLPHVFRFNAEASPSRHAKVALALGVAPRATDLDTAYAGAERLQTLAQQCGLDLNLASHGVEHSAIPHLAKAAMTVTRLLKNNPRELTEQDCVDLYAQCFA